MVARIGGPAAICSQAGMGGQRKAAAGGDAPESGDGLELFHRVTREWFRTALGKPTPAQRQGWPAIARGESTLLLAPTGTGKTLAAFLWCLDRLMLGGGGAAGERGCRVVYLSPLKALAVDVERNLRRPLAGIAEVARRQGVAMRAPEVAVRTGDTPQAERARFRRAPAEILITTPESLYLLLTSEAAAALRTVETVIVDEIHALVPTKRGAHLALSLERLEAVAAGRVQRIGLSATQRPLEEVAHFLGGQEPGTGRRRAVTVVNAAARKPLKLRVEVPVEDLARRDEQERQADPSAERKRPSIWSAIPPRLVEIVRKRRSTLIFVNNRRTAERLAGAMNELAAGEGPLARAHHGSLAAAQRSEIEEQLKTGQLRALVATSSLELGIDMGAIDLVVQIESPPSVASGMQRIGRAGHRVGAVSEGILFPKYRADLVACAAMTRAMHEGQVESTAMLRNPLDVLAQQVVAIVAHPPRLAAPRGKGERPREAAIGVEELYALVRRAAPFAGLSRAALENVLDLLSGRYPSEEFSELRPRITWDREGGMLMPREGAKSLAVLNAGTIPDRGLYGVFLSGEHRKPVRVGELDEEMVFESRVGEVFLLGASAWRIDEIGHDRVLVSPAPGRAGKMPFWHGDLAGRPLEFGRKIGALVRELRGLPANAAISRLVREHDLDAQAAENLLGFLSEQAAATGVVPDDRNVVVERIRDELGDWRVCVLTPFGGRVHAPWAMAAAAQIAAGGGPQVETMWTDDGFVLRFPDTEARPEAGALFPDAEAATDLVTGQLGGTSLFAAKFREASARALLLPRRRRNARAPLWQQRKRAQDLLAVAARYPSFPMVLEAHRECLRDTFDMPGLVEVLRAVGAGEIQVRVADTEKPSPFAASLLFGYVGNFIYEGDAPPAERRAAALAIDLSQLRELLGDADLREVLDAATIGEVEAQLQMLGEGAGARSEDGIHDMLLRLGDLSREEIGQRAAADADAEGAVTSLLRARRIVKVRIAGEPRLIAVEDAARYRDGLGVTLPAGVPKALLESAADPVTGMVRRYARTHGPFTAGEAARRLGLAEAEVEGALRRLAGDGRVLEGGFRPGGGRREWCDAEALRLIRNKSLARLRKEIEPAEPRLLARLETHWQGVLSRRRGLDALLDTVESLQGAPLAASLLETQILPARLAGYQTADLDRLIGAGEVVWRGVDSLGERDGRIALYLADEAAELAPARGGREAMTEREAAVMGELARAGARFFAQLHEATGGGYPGETVDALWSLVWRGLATNDTMQALRAYVEKPESGRSGKRQHQQGAFRSRRTTPPSAQGRWSLAATPSRTTAAEQTQWSHAMARQLLRRYGIVTRETAGEENLPGGFGAVYEVLKALEAQGRVRRGYFVAGLGAAQFAEAAAVDLLRSLRANGAKKAEIVALAASDPANPWGGVVRWPEPEDGSAQLTRAVGATVVLRNGAPAAYFRRSSPALQVFLPDEEPDRSTAARELAGFLADYAQELLQIPERRHHGGLLIATIGGRAAHEHGFARYLREAGFQASPRGFHVRYRAGRAERDEDGSEAEAV